MTDLLYSSSQVMLEPGYLVKDPASARPIVYLAVVDEGGDREYHDAIAEVRVCSLVFGMHIGVYVFINLLSTERA